MNYIKHLTGFFDRIIQDTNLNPTHISLYIALFQFWNVNRFKNPISITREEVMHISKICSKATYHKCMRELNEKKYIKYMPSFNPFKGSMVILINFSEDPKPIQKRTDSRKKNELALNKQETSGKTGTEQALVSSINNINKTNIENDINLVEPSAHFQMHVAFSNYEKNKMGKNQHFDKLSSAEKNKPALDQIKIYFEQQNFPEIEAQKFFNYFASNGWLVGGKTPMVDWKASAQNWILNADKFNVAKPKTNRAKHLNSATNKNYTEPL
ncbi:transcriptional regulator [Flavobacterium sp. A45]|uniref:transcriptional regulator n=1 Tax=Flavobacterium sp. A45 TaxID=1945862 RepID=UPI000985D83B|nr:transcriptional regulator [Flavobacterium sp. A45]OOG75467.1 transcriptional regulator [Flavobacterium sp. A45]